jgi:ligand-binding sensor domain-containing protein/serine phosphatase RsbU (regulator of sigma subunit)
MDSYLNRKIIISIVCCLFILSEPLSGQTYRFRNIGADYKIPDEFIYTINQDLNRYLWVGTGKGLSKFDGFEFFDVPFPDLSKDRYATAGIQGKDGKLWFGCNDGSVYFTSGNDLREVSLGNSRTISELILGPDGLIYVIPQGEAIFSIDPENPWKVKTFNIDGNLVLFSACFAQKGELLIGTQDDIHVCVFEGDSIRLAETIIGLNYAGIRAIHQVKSDSSFIIGTEGSGLFRLTISNSKKILSRWDNYPELENLSIQTIYKDPDDFFWVSTYDAGVYRLKLTENLQIESLNIFDKKSGLPGNSIKLVFHDFEGNYWIGLFGEGLSVLNSLSFSFYSPGLTPEANNIIYINQVVKDYFLGTSEGYYLYDLNNNKARSFVNLRNKTGNSEIASYHVDAKGNIWIGTKGNGLYVKNTSGSMSLAYKSFNSTEDYITDIESDANRLWLGTLNGVIILDIRTKAFIGRYNINNGLPHNVINKIYITTDGNAAIATKTDKLYLINPEAGVIAGNTIMAGATMNEVRSFCQTRNGHLWAATSGNGIFEMSIDSLRAYTRTELLMSDYCYSTLADSSGRIWIGHNGGFSRYNTKNGIMRTFGTDFAQGGDCNADGMFESSDGKILIGTTKGFIVYDSRKDKRVMLAPFNNINYITINDSVYHYQDSYILPFRKRYDVKVHYTGINLRDPEKVSYQSRLENYNDRWSPVTNSREVTYSPGDGKYKFNLISANEDGLSQESPVTFELIIKKPVWRTWWFLLISFGTISGIVILIIREREKSQKKVQIYLEKELEARTSVVMKQKGELELQNIEITDSINYAKRIQTSILPDFNKVQETFRDAFLFFRPRDIVSGDFYWFERLSDDKFILVCADSTGHGVPGAFMSMIGSTILQDIVSRQKITKPSKVLKLLDKQIFSTLNQNVELGVSNDGMDMVVCEINVKDRHIRFASAMRPVILVLDGEPIYVKGNRCSIGGESVIEKYFDDQEYYLNDGDLLYLFSDGLPDQFGGTDGKKMKIARLKKLIEDVSGLPMSGQKEVITRFYDEWKDGYDQVDDILLIGVRL